MKPERICCMPGIFHFWGTLRALIKIRRLVASLLLTISEVVKLASSFLPCLISVNQEFAEDLDGLSSQL